MNGDASSPTSSIVSHFTARIAVKPLATRVSSAATSTFIPAVITPWKCSCGVSRSTFSLRASSTLAAIESASCAVVLLQYSHVLITAHTSCCAPPSRLHCGGADASAGCVIGGSRSSTRRA